MRQLRFSARLTGAIGISELFTVDWPERPTKADVMALYEKYDHIQQPTLIDYDCDGLVIKTPYPEFYNIA